VEREEVSELHEDVHLGLNLGGGKLIPWARASGGKTTLCDWDLTWTEKKIDLGQYGSI
jgi:hypothetical protein